jgi:hypothetical protein
MPKKRFSAEQIASLDGALGVAGGKPCSRRFVPRIPRHQWCATEFAENGHFVLPPLMARF